MAKKGAPFMKKSLEQRKYKSSGIQAKKSSKARGLSGSYHPDSVKYMLEKANGKPLSNEDAEKYDQEWAAEKLSKTRHQASTEDLSNIMQQTPNNVPVRGMSASPQFKQVVEDRKNEARATSETNYERYVSVQNSRIPGTGNSHT